MTAVELLIEQIKSKADNLPTNTKENRMAKGIYVDCLIMAKEAKEMEKQQQGYSDEEVAERFVNNRFTKKICGDEFYPDILASKSSIVESHILFAKWQQERSYKLLE